MKVVYNSYGGRYSDNPRAIYEELLSRDGEYTHIWTVNPVHEHGFPPGVETVRWGSPECIRALETADVIVSNTHIDLDWTKRRDAEYLQTWHGTPLKHIHGDVMRVRPEPVELTDEVLMWDHLLSPNHASTERLRNAFGFTGEVAETGYPRNDVLVSPEAGRIRARVRAELGIDDDRTVVLYTPTWRDDLVDEHGRAFRMHLDLDAFAERLGDDHVLLLRLHYFLSGRLGGTLPPGVLDVSFRPQVSDLYLAADVMITDYSSTMFDFAVTGKPLLFYTYDLAHYRDTLRGFYFDFHLAAPGPLLHTSEQVLDALTDLDTVRLRYQEAYARFRGTFAHLEDGHASERVVDRYFGTGRGAVVDLDRLVDPAGQAGRSGSVR